MFTCEEQKPHPMLQHGVWRSSHQPTQEDHHRDCTAFSQNNQAQIAAFLQAIKGHRYEALFTTTLFTGTREGEIFGLQWNCVDLEKGTITIKHQLQKVRGSQGEYTLVPTKNGKSRTITVGGKKDQIRSVQYQRLPQQRNIHQSRTGSFLLLS